MKKPKDDLIHPPTGIQPLSESEQRAIIVMLGGGILLAGMAILAGFAFLVRHLYLTQ